MITGVLASLVLLHGCGEDAAEPDAGGPTASAEPTSSDAGAEETASPSPGQVGSEECSLARSDVDLVVRDWTRVQDTVGRGDHGRYTSGLVGRLDRLASEASKCEGSDLFEGFVEGVEQLDEGSDSPPDYDLYATAEQAGNEWLDAAGLGENALLRG
jgi:hypothetical protein